MASQKGRGMNFSWALEEIKSGKKIHRSGWNGKGMWAVLQRGYPDGILINTNTIKATGLPAGTVCKFRPYLMLHAAQKDFAMWVPSVSDLLAEDWAVVE